MSGRSRERLGPLAVAGLSLVVTAVFAAGSLWLGGFHPGEALAALVQGAFGSWTAFLSITLVRSVPLILTGLAVALAFRAGVWNIGAEGQLYAGAVAAMAMGFAAEGAPAWILIPLVLGAAALAGMIWALIPAVMKLRLGVGEVITTILMNYVGIHLAAWMVMGPLQEARKVFPQTEQLTEAARLPLLRPGTPRLHVGFLLALLLGVALWAMFRWTRFGFLVRAVGSAPKAAEIAGRIPSGRVILVTFLLSGAIAGLAGGVEVSGVTFRLYDGMSPGWGYTAIAVALLGGLHPGGVVVAGILFGALEGGAGAMQREAGIPHAWVTAVEAMVILSVLAADRGWRRWNA